MELNKINDIINKRNRRKWVITLLTNINEEVLRREMDW
jgi:hypothetical protein